MTDPVKELPRLDERHVFAMNTACEFFASIPFVNTQLSVEVFRDIEQYVRAIVDASGRLATYNPETEIKISRRLLEVWLSIGPNTVEREVRCWLSGSTEGGKE